MAKHQKLAIGREFSAGRIRIICATSAFGMGINYPHVERVFHLHFLTIILSAVASAHSYFERGLAPPPVNVFAKNAEKTAAKFPAV